MSWRPQFSRQLGRRAGNLGPHFGWHLKLGSLVELSSSPVESVCYSLSHIQLFVTPWTVVCQASLSMEFSRQEYCSGLPFPTPRDLPDPGIEPTSPGAQMVKNLPAMQETRLRSLGREDPLEKEMAIHSSSLAWKIPWTEEPDSLHTVHGVARVGHD